ESQIEKLVKGRLRFAVDCGIISGAKNMQAPEMHFGPLQEEERRRELHDKSIAVRYRELVLAISLLRLPPPCLPYHNIWFLHFLRQLWPFRHVGSVPMVRNESFRSFCEYEYGRFGKEIVPPRLEEVEDENDPPRWESIEWPKHVPDDRLAVRI